MLDLNAALSSMHRTIEAMDYRGLSQDALVLQHLLGTVESFWTARRVSDAISIAKDGSHAATELEAASKARNDVRIRTAAEAVSAACGSCHASHRERLPDGSYEMK